MVQVLGRTIADSVEDFLASRQAGHTNVLQERWARLEAEKVQKRAALEKANNALSRLSLLLEQETYLAASRYLEAVARRPADPDNGGLFAHLNNVLRRPWAPRPCDRGRCRDHRRGVPQPGRGAPTEGAEQRVGLAPRSNRGAVPRLAQARQGGDHHREPIRHRLQSVCLTRHERRQPQLRPARAGVHRDAVLIAEPFGGHAGGR